MHLVGLIIRTVLVIGDAYGYCELTNLRIIKKKKIRCPRQYTLICFKTIRDSALGH